MPKINLYESIDEYSVQKTIAQLNQSAGDVSLHIHSYGGSVFDGILLINNIKRYNRGGVTAVIDGVCASMATFVAMSCGTTKMADNGFLMIHAPSYSLSGSNSADLESAAKLLKDIESEFVRRISAKIGRPIEEAEQYMNGADYWFTAAEAKALGLIDEVIEANPDNHFTKADAAARLQKIFNQYNQPNKQAMEPIQLKREVLELLDMKKSDDMTPKDVVEKLSDKLLETAKELDALHAKVQAEKDKTIAAEVDAAIRDKKAAEAHRQTYINIGKTAGIESLRTALSDIKPYQPLSFNISAGDASEVASTREWNWDAWQEKDPRGLEAMAAQNPERFEALYQGKYGK